MEWYPESDLDYWQRQTLGYLNKISKTIVKYIRDREHTLSPREIFNDKQELMFHSCHNLATSSFTSPHSTTHILLTF